jgi:hypothetical protein
MAALLAGSALIAIPLGTGDAAAAAAKSKTTHAQSGTRPAQKSVDATSRDQGAADPEAIAAKRNPQYTSAAGGGTATDEGCLRQRKRLWIEGEGWMVRKVTVCP